MRPKTVTHCALRPSSLALALIATGLIACSSQPPASEVPAATAPTAANQAGSAAGAASQPGAKQHAQLRQDLEAIGVGVSDTPEGLLKINIPGDTSFGLGRVAIEPAFARVLNGLAEVLNKHPTTAIDIVGHTDASGSDAVNLSLSKRRAESARDHLVAREVAADRIRSEGWGSDQPVADNNTAAGRAANRRVEIFVGAP